MTSLYTADRLRRMERREKLGRALVWGLSAVSLAVCVLCCLNTHTGNEKSMYITTAAVSVVGGWTVMALAFFFWIPSRAEARHMQGMLQEKTEETEGVLCRTDNYFSIPRSITVRKVCLRQGEETLTLRADAELSRELPPDGTRVRVRHARRYITAWEAAEE